MSKRRTVVRVGLAAAALVLVMALVAPTAAAPSGITWGTRGRATLSNKAYFRGSVGPASAIGVDGGTTWNYSIYYQDFDYEVTGTYAWPYCANGSPPDDPAQCPFRVGVYFERNASNGDSAQWQDRFRLNAEDEHGERTVIAADGANVIAAWVTQVEYYTSKVGTKKRVLMVRTNNNYGDPGSWATAIAVSDPQGRVDYPYLAYENGMAYLVWTDSDTGKIWLTTSNDGGATWTAPMMIGKSKATFKGPYPYGPQGYGAKPAIAVSDDGMTVAVVWLAMDSKGLPTKLQTRTSNDGGATWSAESTLQGKTKGNAPVGSGGMDRVGFVYMNPAASKGFYREFTEAGGWQDKVVFATMPQNTPQKHFQIYTAGVGLNGASKTAVAYGGCYDNPCDNYKGKGIALFYTETLDGAVWSDVEMVSQGGEDGSINYHSYAPTVYFDGADRRNINWQGLNKNWWNYQRSFRSGTSV